jgi:hypothetical protein
MLEGAARPQDERVGAIAPTICRPIGRPARVRPPGMEAEWPAQNGSPKDHPQLDFG